MRSSLKVGGLSVISKSSVIQIVLSDLFWFNKQYGIEEEIEKRTETKDLLCKRDG